MLTESSHAFAAGLPRTPSGDQDRALPGPLSLTAETGQVGTNSPAARHYLASPDAPATWLVAAALAWRLEQAGDEATALVSRELIPLYLHYVDDHIARLRAIDHHRLADSFERWRSRLLA